MAGYNRENPGVLKVLKRYSVDTDKYTNTLSQTKCAIYVDQSGFPGAGVLLTTKRVIHVLYTCWCYLCSLKISTTVVSVGETFITSRAYTLSSSPLSSLCTLCFCHLRSPRYPKASPFSDHSERFFPLSYVGLVFHYHYFVL